MQAHRTLAGLIAGTAALMPGAGTALAQTAPADPAGPQMASPLPVPLFKAVCVDGGAKLSRKWAAATTYSAIPAAAKAAVGKSDSEVPNSVFQIGGGTEFLILPAPAPGPVFADSCAVVWQGANLAEARTMVPLATAGTAITATETKGWIMLRSMPAPTPTPTPSR